MAKLKLVVTTFRLRRKKIIGLFIFTLLNLLLTVGFAILVSNLMRSPGRFICAILTLWSFMLTVFGVIAIIWLAREHFIGFFISADGLNDISTGHNYGVIMWKDVTKIRIVNDIDNPKRKYIVLKLCNPQEYIDREPSRAKRRSMELKLHYYGSPICFSNRALNCTFTELESTVRMYYDNYLLRMEEKKEKEASI